MATSATVATELPHPKSELSISTPARDFAGELRDFAGTLGRVAAEASGPTPSRELTVSLVVAGSGGLTTDDSAEVAAIVDEIHMKPHLFAERFLKLERDHAALLERVNGLCAREVI